MSTTEVLNAALSFVVLDHHFRASGLLAAISILRRFDSAIVDPLHEIILLSLSLNFLPRKL